MRVCVSVCNVLYDIVHVFVLAYYVNVCLYVFYIYVGGMDNLMTYEILCGCIHPSFPRKKTEEVSIPLDWTLPSHYKDL